MLRSTFLIAAVLGWASLGRAETTAEDADGRPPAPESFKRLARKIEPNLKGQSDRLPQYVDFFRREVCNDTRLIAFDVRRRDSSQWQSAIDRLRRVPGNCARHSANS